MAKKQAKIIKELRKFLIKIGAEEGILFGSRGRGDNLENSDVDLVIISNKFAGQRYMNRFYNLHKNWSLPYFLEAFPYTKEELKKLATRGIKGSALRNGVRIKIKK